MLEINRIFSAKFPVMKKIFLRIMVYALCFAFVAGCSKNVKAPVNKATATTNKTTSTQT
jgi:hypothetical protein